MKNNRRLKKMFACIMASCLLLAHIPALAAPPSFSDVSGHWAQAAILRWSEAGVINGYPDGTFRPNNPVRRGELAAIINNLMHFPSVPADAELFSDTKGKWYAEQVNSLALQGAYLETHGEAKGDEVLTREEAAVMIFNSFPIRSPINKPLFSDYSDISPANREKVRFLYNADFISGFPDGSFRPKDSITRAQALTIINNMITDYIDEPGTYDTFEGNGVFVAVPGVNLKIDGTLHYIVISPNAGMGKTVINDGENVYSDGWGVPPAKYLTAWVLESKSLSVGLVQNSITNTMQIFDTRFAGGYGKEFAPYLITNQAQLELIGEQLGKSSGICFKLSNEIVISGQWMPLGGFFGSLDGGGHKISGLNIEAESGGAGLFSALYGSSSIKNLSIEAKIKANGGSLEIGALAGSITGTVDNCYATVTVEGESGRMTYVGGLAGIFRGSGAISNSAAKLTTDMKSESVYTGGIAGGVDRGAISGCSAEVRIDVTASDTAGVGGIAGRLVTGATLAGCETKVEISAHGQNNVYGGGIAGFSESAEINNCESSGSIQLYMPQRNEEGFGAVAGGIAGFLVSSDVTGCISSAKIYAEGGYYSYAGGVAGNVSARITDNDKPSSVSSSCATGDVMAAGSLMQNNSGGLAGQVSRGTIRTSWASGTAGAAGNPGYFNAVGGFAGSCYEEGYIENCYSTGLVWATDDFWFSYGGFVGRLGGEVKTSYATGAVERTDSAGRVDRDYVMVGSGRSDGHIEACFDLMDSVRGYPLYVTQNPGTQDVMERISIAAIKNTATFIEKGWNFDEVWGASISGYPLPILKGVYEELQISQLMPAHLS